MVEPRYPEVSSETLAAACVALNGRAVLIESRDTQARAELALRLVDRGGSLIAGEHTICQRQDGQLIACAPTKDRGRIEVAGLGIVELPSQERAQVDLLIVILDTPTLFPQETTRRLAGIPVRVVTLAALDPAAPAKIAVALGQLHR